MIRSELCLVAQIAPATFNSHRRNGDLPFKIWPCEVSDTENRTWSRFGLYEAMMLIAARNLASGQGVSWSEAARMLREDCMHLPGIDEGPPELYRGPGFHCARIEFRCEDGHLPQLHSQFQVVRGALAEIANYAEREVAAFNRRQHFSRDRIAVYSTASVNLSQAWHIALARATDLKIHLDADLTDGPSVGSLDHE